MTLFDQLHDTKEANRKQRTTTPDAERSTYDGEGDGTPYGLAGMQGEIDALLDAPEGNRDDTANKVALKLGRLVAGGQLTETAARAQLEMVTESWEYGNGDPFTWRDVDRWMRSGFTAGLNEPRQPDDMELWQWISPSPADSLSAMPVASSSISSSMPLTGDADASAGSNSPKPLTGSNSATPTTPEDRFNTLVARKAGELTVAREAKRLVDHRDAIKAFRDPPYVPTLTAELQLPEDPVTFAVAELMPTGTNVVVTAQYKTGKTTLINSLTKAIADGQPFLGRFDVADRGDGRIGIWNYEVGDQQYRRWLRAVQIDNTDRITLLNLRGYRVPFGDKFGEDYAVKWLNDHAITFWVLDPYARAMLGSVSDESNNTEVGWFLDTIDVIKARAGVSELVIPAHTGRSETTQDRARGATRLNDWADVQWVLSRDTEGNRFIGANGRDVNVAAGGLKYDDPSGSYTWTGAAPAEAAATLAEAKLLSWIARNPGIVTRRLGDGPGVNKHTAGKNVASLIEQGMVRVIPGAHGAKHYYIHNYEGEFVPVDRMAKT